MHEYMYIEDMHEYMYIKYMHEYMYIEYMHGYMYGHCTVERSMPRDQQGAEQPWLPPLDQRSVRVCQVLKHIDFRWKPHFHAEPSMVISCMHKRSHRPLANRR